jgi:hypothetical protein
MNSSHFDAYTLGPSASNAALSTLSRRFSSNQIPMVGMLAASQETELMNVLNSFLNRFNSIAVHLTVYGRFAQYDAEGQEISRQNIPMRSNTLILHSGSRHLIQRQMNTLFASIEDRVESLQLVGSGCSLQYITAISVNIARRDYAGSAISGEMFVSHLTAKQKSAIADVAAAERIGCLFSPTARAYLPPRPTASSFPVGSVEAMQTKFYIDPYMDTRSIQRPVKLSQLDKFEKINRLGMNFALNVFMNGTYGQ